MPDGECGQAAPQDAPKARIHVLLAAAHYRATLRACPEARRYLQNRGIGGAVAARFGLDYARPSWRNLGGELQGYDDETVSASGLVVPKNERVDGSNLCFDRFRGRVMFPIRDCAGTLADFGGRILQGTTDPLLKTSAIYARHQPPPKSSRPFWTTRGSAVRAHPG